MDQAKINKRFDDKFHRSKIVTITKSWIGTPYHHQESVKHIGCDCLGLVRGVYEELYQKETAPIRPYSKDWAEQSKRETLIEAANEHLVRVNINQREPGDVLIFRFRKWMIAKHTGILTAPDKMVHAIEGAKVEEVHLNKWWQRHLAAVFSFPQNSI